MLVPKVVDRGGEPRMGCAWQDRDCRILQPLPRSQVRWGWGFPQVQPADQACELAVSDQNTTSMIETVGLRLSFFSFRTTGYSGLVSCKGTNLMIYPLSHTGPSNSSLMWSMCCEAPAVSSHFGLAHLLNSEHVWTTEIFWWGRQHSRKSPCCKSTLSLLALTLTWAWVIYRRRRMFRLTFM